MAMSADVSTAITRVTHQRRTGSLGFVRRRAPVSPLRVLTFVRLPGVPDEISYSAQL
jgi:hypothetical protein